MLSINHTEKSLHTAVLTAQNTSDMYHAKSASHNFCFFSRTCTYGASPARPRARSKRRRKHGWRRQRRQKPRNYNYRNYHSPSTTACHDIKPVLPVPLGQKENSRKKRGRRGRAGTQEGAVRACGAAVERALEVSANGQASFPSA